MKETITSRAAIAKYAAIPKKSSGPNLAPLGMAGCAGAGEDEEPGRSEESVDGVHAEVRESQSAATPTFSVASGYYTTAQSVTISDTTSGVTIYYTADGTTPTLGST